MSPLLLVMAGGAAGAGARHLVGRMMRAAFGPGWPWGTLTVNILGGFAMGVLVGALTRLSGSGEPWRLLLGVGLLGGFTTFSAFSLDAMLMLERGELASLAAFVLLSVAGSIFALWLGLMLMRVAA